VLIDGSQEFLTDGASPSCDLIGYTRQFVDVSGFADGGTHTLEFHSEVFANNLGISNFFLDLIELPGALSVCTVIPATPIFADGFESGNTSAWSTTVN
jgi:hypothetical protein